MILVDSTLTMDDALYRCDEVARVIEPAVWIVDDTTILVLFNLVTVDKPFQWGSAIDDIAMCFFWDAG